MLMLVYVISMIHCSSHPRIARVERTCSLMLYVDTCSLSRTFLCSLDKGGFVRCNYFHNGKYSCGQILLYSRADKANETTIACGGFDQRFRAILQSHKAGVFAMFGQERAFLIFDANNEGQTKCVRNRGYKEIGCFVLHILK